MYNNQKSPTQKKFDIAFTVLCIAIIICIIITIIYSLSCNKCVFNQSIESLSYNMLHNFN